MDVYSCLQQPNNIAVINSGTENLLMIYFIFKWDQWINWLVSYIYKALMQVLYEKIAWGVCLKHNATQGKTEHYVCLKILWVSARMSITQCFDTILNSQLAMHQLVCSDNECYYGKEYKVVTLCVNEPPKCNQLSSNWKSPWLGYDLRYLFILV